MERWEVEYRGEGIGLAWSLSSDGMWCLADEADTEIARLRKALEEIEKGEGAYDLDPLKHCSNTVENMKEIAIEALEGEK